MVARFFVGFLLMTLVLFADYFFCALWTNDVVLLELLFQEYLFLSFCTQIFALKSHFLRIRGCFLVKFTFRVTINLHFALQTKRARMADVCYPLLLLFVILF